MKIQFRRRKTVDPPPQLEQENPEIVVIPEPEPDVTPRQRDAKGRYLKGEPRG